MNFLHEAVANLAKGCQYQMAGDTYDGLSWSHEDTLPRPTKQEVEQEVERLKKEYEINQYQRSRANEYPSIQDQLDILYHLGYDGWKEEINKTKQKYPKPLSKISNVGVGTT